MSNFRTKSELQGDTTSYNDKLHPVPTLKWPNLANSNLLPCRDHQTKRQTSEKITFSDLKAVKSTCWCKNAIIKNLRSSRCTQTALRPHKCRPLQSTILYEIIQKRSKCTPIIKFFISQIMF